MEADPHFQLALPLESAARETVEWLDQTERILTLNAVASLARIGNQLDVIASSGPLPELAEIVVEAEVARMLSHDHAEEMFGGPASAERDAQVRAAYVDGWAGFVWLIRHRDEMPDGGSPAPGTRFAEWAEGFTRFGQVTVPIVHCLMAMERGALVPPRVEPDWERAMFAAIMLWMQDAVPASLIHE